MTPTYRHRFDDPRGYLHHRPPYLLIETVDELTDQSVTASRELTGDEPFITGHFPGAPIMPGAMMQEMTTQTAGVLIAANHNPMESFDTEDPFHNEFALGVLVKVRSAKFRGFARPGSRLVATVELTDRLSSVFEFAGRVAVDGEVIMKNEFQLSNIRSELLQGRCLMKPSPQLGQSNQSSGSDQSSRSGSSSRSRKRDQSSQSDSQSTHGDTPASIGVAIVGCGMIANFHARAIADAAGVHLIGVTARRPEAAREFAKTHGCEAFESLAAALSDARVAAVAVCTPSGAHLEPAVAAAAAGKHVVVEKPLEITTERCDQIIAACEAAGVQLAVTFQSRFHRSSQLLKRALETGRFGTVTMGDAYVKWYRSQDYYDSGAWRGTWNLDGGGALMNQAIHSVDLLVWLMGDVDEITAFTSTLTHDRIEVEDTAVATLRFKSGALGVIEATTTAYPGALKRIEIAGSDGSVTLEEESLTHWNFRDEEPEDEELRCEMADATTSGGGAADPSAINHHGHAALFEEVAAAISEGRPTTLSGHEGRRSVQVIEAIYRSAKTGQIVKL